MLVLYFSMYFYLCNFNHSLFLSFIFCDICDDDDDDNYDVVDDGESGRSLE